MKSLLEKIAALAVATGLIAVSVDCILFSFRIEELKERVQRLEHPQKSGFSVDILGVQVITNGPGIELERPRRSAPTAQNRPNA